MQNELPFFEDVEQALTQCVQALGGAKVVGHMLWRDKQMEDARSLLLNCLNSSRKEKLDYTQVMFLFREAKNAGCYAPFEWYSGEIGFDARPVTKAEETDRLTSVVEQSTKTLSAALAQLERIQHANKQGKPK
jgi:hypothetical protein